MTNLWIVESRRAYNRTFTCTETMVDKCNKALTAIYSLKNLPKIYLCILHYYITFSTLRTLTFSHVKYCNPRDTIQRFQRYCFRFLFDLKRDDITPIYIRSKVNKLTDFRCIKILSLTHLILKTGHNKNNLLKSWSFCQRWV